MWGKVRGPTWTHLDGEAAFGATSITVADDVEWYAKLYIAHTTLSPFNSIVPPKSNPVSISYKAMISNHGIIAGKLATKS
jgi:hypothetical protein